MLAAEPTTQPRQLRHVPRIYSSHWTGGTIQQDSAKRPESCTQESPPHAPERRNGCSRRRQDSPDERRGEPAPARHSTIVISRLPRWRRWSRDTDRGGRIASRRFKSAERVRLRRPFICHIAAPLRLLNCGGDSVETQGCSEPSPSDLPPGSIKGPQIAEIVRLVPAAEQQDHLRA